MLIRVTILEDNDHRRGAMAETVRADRGLQLSGVHIGPRPFLRRVAVERPNVVIMSMGLPSTAVFETVRRCKAHHPAVEFLMSMVPDDAEGLFDALSAGALGFLGTDATARAMVMAVKELHGGGSPMSPGIARRVLASFSRPREQAKGMERLSARERQVLEQLAKGHRYKEIADGMHLSIETVRTHIRNLYDKLQVSSRTDALNKFHQR